MKCRILEQTESGQNNTGNVPEKKEHSNLMRLEGKGNNLNKAEDLSDSIIILWYIRRSMA